MKNYPLYALVAVCLLLFNESGKALSFPPGGVITLNGTLNTSCVPHDGGTVYLQIELDAQNFPTTAVCRHPMNIAVVLDRSGSMADARKIDYAKKAINSLVDGLTSEDYLSIVIYDDQIDVLLPAQRVVNKERIKRMVREISPRGSTNLGGGMVEGFQQIERNFRNDFVNRVILLSDGLANTGITDPRELDRIARMYRDKSISLTTMGVGLEYNENLMLGLAEHGGGNYYFLESPHQMASIFERELNGIALVVAQNAHIELTLADGVALSDAVGCEWTHEGNSWILPVGDLYANARRELTVELSVPEGSGTRRIATGVLRFREKNGWLENYPRFSVDIRYTDNAAELEKGKNWDTQAKVDVALSTRTVERAMQALDAGRSDEAREQLEDAKAKLLSSPAMVNSAAGAPAMNEQIKQLEEYSRDITNSAGDLRRAKKSIQYNNHKMQKSK